MNGNPQIEDGYIKIANELGEALAKTNLSPYESRIFWAILRKTYGWHKKSDWISLSQFIELTGLIKPDIIRAIKKLIKKNIITQTGNDKGKEYSINKHYTKWNSLPKQVIVTQTGNKSLPKQVPTKANIQKQIIINNKKSIINNKPYSFSKWFYEFRNIPAEPTPIDMRNFKLLMYFYPAEFIQKGIIWRLAHDPDGYYHKNMTSAMVYRQFGNWIAESSMKAISFKEWLKRNPDYDYEKFEDQLARADHFLIAFSKVKDAIKKGYVYLIEEDYEMYRKAIRIKSKEVAKEVK